MASLGIIVKSESHEELPHEAGPIDTTKDKLARSRCIKNRVEPHRKYILIQDLAVHHVKERRGGILAGNVIKCKPLR